MFFYDLPKWGYDVNDKRKNILVFQRFLCFSGNLTLLNIDIIGNILMFKCISGSLSHFETSLIVYYYLNKRHFIIDQQLGQHFVQYSEFLSNPLPFYETQIINPFIIQGSEPITSYYGRL